MSSARRAVEFGTGAMEVAHRVIAVGKQADIIVLRYDSLHLQPIVDPYATIVQQAGIADLDVVMVAGEILERQGTLTSPLQIEAARLLAATHDRLQGLPSRGSGLSHDWRTGPPRQASGGFPRSDQRSVDADRSDLPCTAGGAERRVPPR